MKYEKERLTISGLGMAIVCIAAVLLSASSILSTYRMQKMTSQIYEHPYTVSNEARATRSRLLDMRFFILTMFTQPDQDMSSVQEILNQRYSMQYESIETITSQYLGPKEDSERLMAAMRDLEETQNEAVPILLPLSESDTYLYIEEHLYPKYDAVNEALMTIIEFADEKVKSLEEGSKVMAAKATVSAILLTIFLPAYFLFVFWREKKNSREIRYRERLFDILSTNVDEVFFILNVEQDSLEYVSANCERVLGIDGTMITKEMESLRSRIVEEEKPVFDEFIRKKEFENEKSISVRMQFPTGELHWISLQVFREMVHDKVTRYIISISDQSEEMRIRQTLKDALINAQNANTAKQNFLSRMSHEIRTPMNAIIGMTAIAAAYIDDRKRVEGCLEKIGYSSKHLMTLINDVLDMSKIDEGKMTIAKERFNLENVAESITSIVYPQAVERKLEFHMPLVDITETELIGDSLRLNQILINLLSNSLKFTPEGGSITLEIRQLQKKNNQVRFRFTVQDTGIGMNKEFMNRLFLPFEQEDATTSQKYGGTGLGMSITKNLVTLMGGTIAVDSEPGKGSTFSVELDFSVPEEMNQLHHRAETIDALSVLIADDDRDSCLHTSLMLEKLGIVACWVLSGAECVEKVVDAHKIGNDFDVCLIDWRMPDMNGIEVTRRVRECVGPDTTIIIITAYDWSPIEQAAREAGANAFLSKPIFASTLYNTLLSVTGVEKVLAPQKFIPEDQEMTGRRVLLVEDNELNCEIAMELLGLMKIEADCASNGQEAIDMFLPSGDRYDLILMDVQMPVMNGYQATEIIRGSDHPRAKTIPIIAMTANAFHEDVVKAYEAGMNGHLAKPVDFKQLYQMIKTKILEADEGGKKS